MRFHFHLKYLKLTDFGFGDDFGLKTDIKSIPINANIYMAPEVARSFVKSTQFSIKADIFSLGIIAQELFDFDINS